MEKKMNKELERILLYLFVIISFVIFYAVMCLIGMLQG